MDSEDDFPRRDSQHNHSDSYSTPPPPQSAAHQKNASAAILEQKISRARKRIQEEQRRRDANVDEYLRTAATAPRNQLPQVKAVFEKRNTKAATHIAGLQRKLDRYQRDLEALELDAQTSPNRNLKGEGSGAVGSPQLGKGESEASGSSNASSNKASKGRLQHVSQGIKTVIGKPREIASYLLKQKFGSADNIPAQVRDSEGYHGGHGSANIPSDAHNISAPIHSSQNTGDLDDDGGFGPTGSECSASAKSSSLGRDARLPQQSHNNSHNNQNLTTAIDSHEVLVLMQQMSDLREEILSLREDVDNLKDQVHRDSSAVYQGLQEEKFRSERLEEQVNDLTELYQAETGNLKQALADAEEKLSYQSEERLRDLAEMLDSCQAKISRLEQQQQQLVTIEGIENSAARALVVKLVNIGLTMLQLLLLIVATTATTLAPFVGSRFRLLASILLCLIVFLANRKYPQAHELVLEYWNELLNRL